MKKVTNIKIAQKKSEDDGMKDVREIVETNGLNKISCYGTFDNMRSVGDDLLKNDKDTNGRLTSLISNSLSRLALVNRVLFHAGEDGSKLEGKEFDGVELAVKEVYAMIDAAMALDCRRPAERD